MLTPAPLETDRPQTRQFRRRIHVSLLAPDAVARQGRVATLAWERLRDSAAAAGFLNTHDQRLGGRPIDLAIADDDGFRAVLARLDALHPAG